MFNKGNVVIKEVALPAPGGTYARYKASVGRVFYNIGLNLDNGVVCGGDVTLIREKGHKKPWHDASIFREKGNVVSVQIRRNASPYACGVCVTNLSLDGSNPENLISIIVRHLYELDMTKKRPYSSQLTTYDILDKFKARAAKQYKFKGVDCEVITVYFNKAGTWYITSADILQTDWALYGLYVGRKGEQCFGFVRLSSLQKSNAQRVIHVAGTVRDWLDGSYTV